MPLWSYFLIGGVLFFLVLPAILMFVFSPSWVYKAIMTRRKPSHWSREEPSDRNNPDMLYMWDEALRFRKENKDKEEEFSVTTSDGLKIASLYFDFGSEDAVIIMPGRPESCIYSLFYAYPYAAKGINVCVIDARAHGLSEGNDSGVGYKEQEDIMAVLSYLINVKKVKRVLFHGICVGCSSLSYVAAREDCPKEVKGLFTDGMYITFYETLRHRIAKAKGPVPIVLASFRRIIKKKYGIDIKNEGPITNVPKIHLPVQMIASKEDIFSLPKYTELLYETLASEDKKLEWWEHGKHSHLRRVDPAHYDQVVSDFVDHVLK